MAEQTPSLGERVSSFFSAAGKTVSGAYNKFVGLFVPSDAVVLKASHNGRKVQTTVRFGDNCSEDEVADILFQNTALASVALTDYETTFPGEDDEEGLQDPFTRTSMIQLDFDTLDELSEYCHDFVAREREVRNGQTSQEQTATEEAGTETPAESAPEAPAAGFQAGLADPHADAPSGNPVTPGLGDPEE